MSVKLGNKFGEIAVSCLGWQDRYFSSFIPFGVELKSNKEEDIQDLKEPNQLS